ncbi:MAG: DUF2304 domain-containing protein [Deltaproteobacteria bacterium]|nr:DUF2304 domain-containing protein [Deltaproteobacteria bacterium]
MTRIQIIAVAASVSLLLFVIDMIRRRKLLEKYALLWILGGAGLLVLSAWPGVLDRVAPIVGISYPPAVLFLGGLFLLILLVLHFSLAVSKLSEQNRTLAQRFALRDGKRDE